MNQTSLPGTDLVNACPNIDCKHIVYTRAAMDILRMLCHVDLTTPVVEIQCNITDTTKIVFQDDRRSHRLKATTILDTNNHDTLSGLKGFQRRIAVAKAVGIISSWILEEEIKKLSPEDQKFIRQKYANAFN